MNLNRVLFGNQNIKAIRSLRFLLFLVPTVSILVPVIESLISDILHPKNFIEWSGFINNLIEWIIFVPLAVAIELILFVIYFVAKLFYRNDNSRESSENRIPILFYYIFWLFLITVITLNLLIPFYEWIYDEFLYQPAFMPGPV